MTKPSFTLKKITKEKADKLFSVNDSDGLHFSSKGYKEEIEISSLRNSYKEVLLLGFDNQIWKKVQYLKSSKTICFDKFIPSDNLIYALYYRINDEVYFEFVSNKANYSNTISCAQKLSETYEVLLVELQINAILFDEFPSNHHPFEIAKGESQFFYKRSHGAFSFLYPNSIKSEMDKRTALSYKEGNPYGLMKYFPMGHASLGFFKRLELYSQNKQYIFADSDDNDKEFIVFDRYNFSEKLETYKDAKAYIQQIQDNSNSLETVEYIIATKIGHYDWH